MTRNARMLALLLLVGCLCHGCSLVPRRVAVMDFENNTGEARYDYLESAVPEYIMVQLVNTRQLQMLERQDVHRYLREIDEAEGEGRLTRWQKVGRALRAQYLIAGSVSRLERNFILSARLFDVQSGEVIRGSAVTETCRDEDDIYYRAQALALRLANILRPSASAPIEPEMDWPRPLEPGGLVETEEE